jgi:hypothetical protein
VAAFAKGVAAISKTVKIRCKIIIEGDLSVFIASVSLEIGLGSRFFVRKKIVKTQFPSSVWQPDHAVKFYSIRIGQIEKCSQTADKVIL